MNDYHQKIGMADLEWSFGRVETHAEAARSIWETPTVGKLAVDSGYLELRYAMGFGLYLAGRFDAMRFGDVAGSDGVTRRWDSDLHADRDRRRLPHRSTLARQGRLPAHRRREPHRHAARRVLDGRGTALISF